jgi:YgiT-type zinc finger domain-containing protein
LENEKEIMNITPKQCPLCGGRVESGRTTFSADVGGLLFVARHVPAQVCEQCGEEWIDNTVAQDLERLAAESISAHREIEIVSLAA